MLRTHLAALALAATALAASGCGSSKTGTTTASTASAATSPVVSPPNATLATGKPLSRAQWIAAGDAICERTQNKIETLAFHNVTQLINHLPQASLYYTAEAEDLAKLVPPASKANDWKQMVEDVLYFSEYARATIAYLKEHSKLSPEATAKTAKIQRNMISIGTRDGFKWCSQGE